ncbi:MAG: hypothetical protein HY074_13985 [Deltaproteobacteria bacterium]|nr:hypothetical protein [Deltaproteobacteria bacterium]
MKQNPLQILHRTPDFVAIDKPSGLLVHRSALSNERESCVSLLRAQLGEWVHPIHRLDRATSGIVLFAFNPVTAGQLAKLFRDRKVTKTYVALVRGHTSEAGEIDKPLRKNFENKTSPYREALTRYRRLATAELPFAVGKYASARYSLIEVTTHTGRQHQIRRHMASISHPIIGDTTHGDGRHNLFIREKYGIFRLLLHAARIEMSLDGSETKTSIHSNSLREFRRILTPLIPD